MAGGRASGSASVPSPPARVNSGFTSDSSADHDTRYARRGSTRLPARPAASRSTGWDMQPLSTRALTSQIADDLAWLEQHARQQPGQGHAAGKLRLAAALVRNCIGPFLDDQPPTPLHIV